ncbi:hypothetical protein BDN71DRAFT_852840 [Pleurotus eryngii]|uniref:Uncharacterized protein n=1 Tax=Pleurotus eryngii TaxID=5323 RepID=A0A9P6A7C7_PLEER|nr:hypothetical protein BDN71DRAFT_852840 [Pleurotus eryngii]
MDDSLTNCIHVLPTAITHPECRLSSTNGLQWTRSQPTCPGHFAPQVTSNVSRITITMCTYRVLGIILVVYLLATRRPSFSGPRVCISCEFRFASGSNHGIAMRSSWYPPPAPHPYH